MSNIKQGDVILDYCKPTNIYIDLILRGLLKMYDH